MTRTLSPRRKKLRRIPENGRLSLALEGRINIVKMAILPSVVYRFNAIPINIPTKFFTDFERTLSTLYGKTKKPRIVKTILYKNGTSGGIIIPDFELYYKASVMKAACYWHKNRKADQ